MHAAEPRWYVNVVGRLVVLWLISTAVRVLESRFSVCVRICVDNVFVY